MIFTKSERSYFLVSAPLPADSALTMVAATGTLVVFITATAAALLSRSTAWAWSSSGGGGGGGASVHYHTGRKCHHHQLPSLRCSPRSFDSRSSSSSSSTSSSRCWSQLPAPFFSNQNDNDNNDSTEQPRIDGDSGVAGPWLATSSSSSSSSSSNSDRSSPPKSSISSEKTTWWQALDQAGLALKPAAHTAHEKAVAVLSTTTTTTVQQRLLRYSYLAYSTFLYSVFILYRAYRGFFIILPAVFASTFVKLRAAVDEAPFDTSSTSSSSTDNDDDSKLTMTKKKPSWRTRLTIGVLASIVTMAYVVGGGLRVLQTLVTTALESHTVMDSLDAAARQQEDNEAAILKLSGRSSSRRQAVVEKTDTVNGQDLGLTP
jgi:hypothetical protein